MEIPCGEQPKACDFDAGSEEEPQAHNRMPQIYQPDRSAIIEG
jgi:hypothetical protein